MATRFDQMVQITPQNTRTGAAQGLQSLAGEFQRFGEQQAQSFVQQQAVKAEQAGALEATKIDPNASFDEKLAFVEARKQKASFFGGSNAKAFNRGLMSGYESSINADVRRSISMIELNNPSDVQEYRKAVSAELNGIRKGVDPAILPNIVANFNSQAMLGDVRVNERERVRIRQEQLDAHNSAIDAASEDVRKHARKGNNASSAQAEREVQKTALKGLSAGLYSQEEAYETITRTNKDAIEEQQLRQLELMANNPAVDEDGNLIEGMPAAFAMLDGLPEAAPNLKPIPVELPNGEVVQVPVEYTQEEWDEFKNRARSTLKDIDYDQTKAEADTLFATSKRISTVSNAARTGQISVEQTTVIADDMLRRKEITQPKHESMIQSAINAQAKGTKELEDFTAVAKRLAGDDRIVVATSAVDKFYDVHYLPSIAGLPPEEQQAQKLHYVEREKMLPKTLRNETLTKLRSGDENLIVEAVDLVDQVDAMPGLIDEGFNAEEKAFADNILSMTTGGLSDKEAVEVATELSRSDNQARINAREKTIKDEGWADDYEDEVNALFDKNFITPLTGVALPFVGESAVFSTDQLGDLVRDEIAAEYGKLKELQFKAGSSKEDAAKRASNGILRNWGVTAVTDTVMKYPFERYYAVNGSVDYIREEALEDIRGLTIGLDDKFPEGIRLENVFFREHKSTERLAAIGAPVYQIVLQTETGSIVPIYGPNGEGWAPDKGAEVERVSALNLQEAEAEAKKAKTVKESTAQFPAKLLLTVPF
jgi:hypothetical protein